MPTDLALHIEHTPLCDTHEHLAPENEWLERGPDILTDLFGFYANHDLRTAGASDDAVSRLLNPEDPDIPARFAGVWDAWRAMRFTGYGEGVRILAKEVYGLEELTPNGLVAANETLMRLRVPGVRRRLLEQDANLDHVQVDGYRDHAVKSDEDDFFLYDLNWMGMASSSIDFQYPKTQEALGGGEINLAALKGWQERIFADTGPRVIAVKTQHAYSRTLDWTERTDAEAEAALKIVLPLGEKAPDDAKLCLGDWSLAWGVELAIEQNLPVKIHTGYPAGNGWMDNVRFSPLRLFRLLQRYPKARFVLMHLSYPYMDELLSLAKSYPNVWVDMCWAWSLDPRACEQFVRRFLHTAPINKLFGFGGDTCWPTNTVAYARQARRGLTRALQAEVDEGDLTEAEALEVATRIMRDNAYACFDIEGHRARLAAAHQTAGQLNAAGPLNAA